MGDDKTMTVGPVQMMVIGFAEPKFTGEIVAELNRLREHEFVRIIDALVVQKDDEGNITAVQASDLSHDEAMEMGAIAGALIGFGYGGDDGVEAGAGLGAAAMEDGHLIPDEEVWYVADTIPNGIRGGHPRPRTSVGHPVARRDRRCRRDRPRRRVDPRQRSGRRGSRSRR